MSQGLKPTSVTVLSAQAKAWAYLRSKNNNSQDNDNSGQEADSLHPSEQGTLSGAPACGNDKKKSKNKDSLR